MEKIKKIDGVYEVFPLDMSTSLQMDYYESLNSMPGCVYYNKGLAEARTKDLKFCIFSKDVIGERTRVVMYQDPGDSSMLDESSENPFENPGFGSSALNKPSSFSFGLGKGPEQWFVVFPHRFELLGKEDGVKDVTAFNPAFSTNRFLRDRLKFEGPAVATSTVVSMNFL